MTHHRPNRRDFLRMAGVTSAALALSACGVDVTAAPQPTGTPVSPPTAIPAPTASATARPPSLGELARKLGFDIGFSLSLGYKSFDDPQCRDMLLNFSILTDGMASNPQFTDAGRTLGWDYWRKLSSFAQSNNMSLDLNHFFWPFGYFQDDSVSHYLVDAPRAEVEAYVQGRVKKFFEIPYFTSANFVNEVIPLDPRNGDFNWGNMYNPFYRLYGEDYPYELYKVAWNEAQQTGRTVGRDVHLVYNSASMEVDSKGAQYELKMLTRLKDRLSKELGVERPFDIGMQFHISTATDQWLWNAKKFDRATLAQHLKDVAEVGDVRITEFSMSDTDDVQAQKDILHTIFEGFIDSGVGRSFMMWDPIGSALQLNVDVMPNLVTGSCKPAVLFGELYDILAARS